MDWFSRFEKLDGYSVIMGDDRPCNMKGIGTVQIKKFDGMVRELKKVSYVSQVKKNLISVGALEVLGNAVYIRDGILKITRGSMVVMKCVRHNNLYYLRGSTVIRRVETFISSDGDCTQVWRMRLGHTSEKFLKAPIKKGSLKGASTCNIELGGQDVLDKKMTVKFGTSTHRSEGLLNCVHVSIWRPVKTTPLGGHWYFVSFIDNLFRHLWIYPMRQRFEALGILVKLKDMMEKQTGRKIKELQIGNVERYKNQFLQFGQNTCISTHFTNGIHGLAKKINRSLLEKALYFLFNARLDKSFWAEAIVYASHLINGLSSTAIGSKTPLDIWSGGAA